MENWVWDQYYRSLPMSTYLVAFIVSDLKSLGIITLPTGLKFQVSIEDLGLYSLDTTLQTISIFSYTMLTSVDRIYNSGNVLQNSVENMTTKACSI